MFFIYLLLYFSRYDYLFESVRLEEASLCWSLIYLFPVIFPTYISCYSFYALDRVLCDYRGVFSSWEVINFNFIKYPIGGCHTPYKIGTYKTPNLQGVQKNMSKVRLRQGDPQPEGGH